MADVLPAHGPGAGGLPLAECRALCAPPLFKCVRGKCQSAASGVTQDACARACQPSLLRGSGGDGNDNDNGASFAIAAQ